VASVPQAAALPPAGRRFLWLRVTLRSDDRRRASPRLAQVQAETVGESYMEYLPAVYRREDAQSHFLERWLALFRAELGDLERGLDEMAAHFDPHTAPEDHLRWLASWLAFDPPQDMQGDELRALFSNVRGLYERRGTLAGLGDFIELYIGVRPQIFEAFRERHIWQLGYTSALGCDTALAAGLPDGMIVPGQILADPRYQGLRGDYYNGIGFTQLRLSRVDPVIDFHWYPSSPDPAVQVDSFSVRWTGQVMPRYSERYTLYVSANDGVRLWVDGLLLINAWVDQSTTEYSATIELEAGRWYAIQIEYYEKGGAATIRLAWSSRSQLREIIPQSQLYAVHDEGAPTPSDQPVGGSETLIVGQTVVGQSGPLAGADYGMPLFSEGAHLFSVSLPASLLPAPGQREMLRRMIEAEKPAHTDYHLCFVEATMRVGIQAHIGIDSIVAGPPRPLELDGLALGQDTFLGDKEPAGSSGRIGKHARIGHDTRIG
jgi:phage tail-like protein